MLYRISEYLAKFTKTIATVTGIDVEIVDKNLVRIAGTGIHADGIGMSMEAQGGLYFHALKNCSPLFIDNPTDNPICDTCSHRGRCQEKLTMCSPILINGDIAGVIGLLCYDEHDKIRIQKDRETYLLFLQQMSDSIARLAGESFVSAQTGALLDVLLSLESGKQRHILVLSEKGYISYASSAARQHLGIGQDMSAWHAQCQPAKNSNAPHALEIILSKQDVSGLAPPKSFPVSGSSFVLPLDMPQYNLSVLYTPEKNMGKTIPKPQDKEDANARALQFLVGSSREMKELKQKVLKLSQTASTILITGESGTGKEMFARAIHAAGPRRDNPFVAINCGAIPDNLLESELFGYVKGAFTNASPEGRVGKFELANHGVLFLDEVTTMPPSLQVKLLRVLQERTFTRLGSNTQVPVDVRIIAASNDEILSLVQNKLFREDLYYRLSVIPFRLPPLRCRRQDIPELATHFLNAFCRQYNRPKMHISKDALDILCQYDWPGNIRELENCIEYMANMSQDTVLTPDTLPENIHDQTRLHDQTVLTTAPTTGTLRTMADYERDIIRQAVAQYGNNTKGKRLAAQALGISLATLYRKYSNG